MHSLLLLLLLLLLLFSLSLSIYIYIYEHKHIKLFSIQIKQTDNIAYPLYPRLKVCFGLESRRGDELTSWRWCVRALPTLKWGYKGALDDLCQILSAYGILGFGYLSTNYTFRKALELVKRYVAKGVTFKFLCLKFKGFSEVIVGEITVNPHMKDAGFDWSQILYFQSNIESQPSGAILVNRFKDFSEMKSDEIILKSQYELRQIMITHNNNM